MYTHLWERISFLSKTIEFFFPSFFWCQLILEIATIYGMGKCDCFEKNKNKIKNLLNDFGFFVPLMLHTVPIYFQSSFRRECEPTYNIPAYTTAIKIIFSFGFDTHTLSECVRARATAWERERMREREKSKMATTITDSVASKMLFFFFSSLYIFILLSTLNCH